MGEGSLALVFFGLPCSMLVSINFVIPLTTRRSPRREFGGYYHRQSGWCDGIKCSIRTVGSLCLLDKNTFGGFFEIGPFPFLAPTLWSVRGKEHLNWRHIIGCSQPSWQGRGLIGRTALSACLTDIATLVMWSMIRTRDSTPHAASNPCNLIALRYRWCYV